MSLFDFIKKEQGEEESLDAAVERFRATPGAVLLDVRTPDEYREGHIPGSKNVALQAIECVTEVVPEKQVPLFVYCRSGSRSGRAVAAMKQMGYTKVENIGGILDYHGQLER
ncbi:MAG: rhodanese-like domain-containing protein [Brotaphodocola sp.]